MKKLITAALAAAALAAILPTSALADDPVTPKQGAICNLYNLATYTWSEKKGFLEVASSLADRPAVATFVDTASDFSPSQKKDVFSSWGMWTGWFKHEKAGTYTFLCKRAWGDWDRKNETLYAIWINGKKVLECGGGQQTFDVELNAGFNAVKIIAECNSDHKYPLSITYKKKGSVKEPVSFGPENMYYDDEEDE